jgi:beta-1,4-mannosyltransferase
MSTAPIRIASVPADHPYVRHIGAPGGDSVVRLEDEREPGQRGWWPPRMLEPEWVERHADDFDLFHVQFGFDGRHPEQLRELVATLDRLGKPLVYTVHDLRNPNHEEGGLHDAQMEVLVDAASALVTLTDGAARRIEKRFGRGATVIPHPHVVPLDLMAERYSTPRAPGRPPVVGVHFKSMRANMVGVPLLAALTEGDGVGAARLRVDVHSEIWEPQAPAFRGDLRTTLEYLERGDALELAVHDYFSDVELYDYLASLDVAVLPYRFGTHSGWLEACRDLGTAVVAPGCGCYSDQGKVFVYDCDENDLDGASLRGAVRRAIEAFGAPKRDEGDPERTSPQFVSDGSPSSLPVATASWRRRQRLEIAVAHEQLYRRVLAGAAEAEAMAAVA